MEFETPLTTKVTICVLTYGDYPHLAERVIERKRSARWTGPIFV